MLVRFGLVGFCGWLAPWCGVVWCLWWRVFLLPCFRVGMRLGWVEYHLSLTGVVERVLRRAGATDRSRK